MNAINATERALIDEALASGKVTRIEPTPTKRRGPTRNAKAEARRQIIETGFAEGRSLREIADACNVTTVTIRKNCEALGITVPPQKRGPRGRNGDKVVERKQKVAATKVAAVRDRRRFKTVPVPMGDPSIVTDAAATGTIFPSRVFDPTPSERLLKDGSSQSKIGGDVLVGWLKGARIVTLTLEERATCPRACVHWRSCYGNAMQHSRRWRHGPELIAQLEDEISHLCLHNNRVLVRLHVLGDFWSTKYVAFWDAMLTRHPGLHVFGFTAHKQGTEIGDHIAFVRDQHPRRFWMRHSDMTGPWGSFTVDFPTAQKTIGDAIVCPEQRSAMNGDYKKGRHCGNCGVCWSTDAPVAFVTH